MDPVDGGSPRLRVRSRLDVLDAADLVRQVAVRPVPRERGATGDRAPGRARGRGQKTPFSRISRWRETVPPMRKNTPSSR